MSRTRAATIPAEGIVRALLVALLSCTDNSSSWTPFVRATDPSIVTTGTTELTVVGGRFAPGATAYWDGRRQETAFTSTGTLHVRLDPEATVVAGTATLSVENEGSYRSNDLPVTVFDASLQVISLSPASVPVGTPDFTLTVTGAGFVHDSQVFWNGTPLQTQFSSSTELSARVPAALAAVPGTGAVTVVNPATCGPGGNPPCTATSNPVACSVGLPPGGQTIIEQAGNDLAWDAVHGLIFVSVPANAPKLANTISAIDPIQGTIVASVAATHPHRLAASRDGQYLYAGLGDQGEPATLNRYDLPALTGTVSWVRDSTSGPILDVQVAPGAPHTVAVSLGSAGLLVLDDGTARPAAVPSNFFNSVQWGDDATRLFAANNASTGFDFFVLSAGANGVSLVADVPSVMFGFGSRIHYDPVVQRVYGDLGETVDLQGASLPTFVGAPLFNCVMAPDGAHGKAFFACTEDNRSEMTLTIRSFDLGTRALIASVLLKSWPSIMADPQEFPVRIVRWGSNGLALATTTGRTTGGGRIYLYSSPFVQ